ncbi:hypothetical protein NFI96_004047 [Prochilodus magdalenae]|nr:hypothetical protein NFI96_004047 [Prochilodus magdalenae]
MMKPAKGGGREGTAAQPPSQLTDHIHTSSPAHAKQPIISQSAISTHYSHPSHPHQPIRLTSKHASERASRCTHSKQKDSSKAKRVGGVWYLAERLWIPTESSVHLRQRCGGFLSSVLDERNRDSAKTMTDVCLVNVALADLLFVIALPLIIYNELYSWSMGSWACKLLTGAYSINLYSSMLLLACISGDRYVAIVKASRSIGIRAKAQIYSRLVCSVIWLLAIVLSIPTFLYYDRYEEQDLDVKVEAECGFSFETDTTASLMKVLVPSIQLSVGFFVPMLMMDFCYCSIVLTLLSAQNYQRHKAVRVVLAVVVVFILCHLPFNILVLVHTGNLFGERDCEAEQNILLVLSVSRSVAYLHCCLNPILYAFIGVKFRNHFCKIMEDLWCLGKRYFSSARSSQQTSTFQPTKPTNSVMRVPPHL